MKPLFSIFSLRFELEPAILFSKLRYKDIRIRDYNKKTLRYS